MARSSRSLWTQKILSGNVEKKDVTTLRSRGSTRDALPDVIPGTRLPYSGFVLGIDPSLRGSGFAVVEFVPGRMPKLHFSKTLKLARDVSLATCLGEIYKLCADCCEDFPVRHVALEETIYVNNFKVAQILGAARGAAIAAASVLGRKVFEYPPLRIKQAVVGFGRAQKSQVAGMTKQILSLSKELPFDESDAAAAALCHGYTFRD
jgi:crossover junction endodeoxyribonuclease RuvC